ncbi:MAG TPA: M14 family zinc carboxypeptidase [Armatimonadota bacterium]|jgi:hypothetical protein
MAWLLFFQLLAGVFVCTQAGLAVEERQAPAGITIVPADGFNLAITDEISPEYVVASQITPVHNWFAGNFTHLPVGKQVTIGIHLTADPEAKNTTDVNKWQGLLPLMTYADPTRYESYEWFHKDTRGRWISGDPCKIGDEKLAGMGELPVQQVIPAEQAQQFLSTDRQYWMPWRDVDAAAAVPPLNIFRVQQTFALPSASIAMRVPYTYTYQQAFLARLKARQLPGVFIDEIGATREGRKLQILRLEDSTQQTTPATHRTIIITGREHATEAASSWAVMGALRALLADSAEARALRQDTTWILIPLVDPDGSVASVFDRLTEMFNTMAENSTLSPEALAYARYFTDYVYRGHVIDIAVSVHNLEANEGPNVVCPLISYPNKIAVQDINRCFFDELTKQGLLVADPLTPWDFGWAQYRLYGWCAVNYGAIDLSFEVNDRYAKKRLSLAELQGIGGELARTLVRWTRSSTGERQRVRTSKLFRLQCLERDAYFSNPDHPLEARTDADMVVRGF